MHFSQAKYVGPHCRQRWVAGSPHAQERPKENSLQYQWGLMGITSNHVREWDPKSYRPGASLIAALLAEVGF